VSLEVLEGAGTRVCEQARACLDAAVLVLGAFAVQDAQGLGRHAVDTPLRVAVIIADGDGEATIVSSDQMDQLTVLAFDLEGLAFARVRCVVPVLF